jgi:hypothetical protein
VEGTTETLDCVAFPGRIAGELHTGVELAKSVDADPESLIFEVSQKGCGRTGSFAAFSEQVHQKGRVEVDHKGGALAT